MSFLGMMWRILSMAFLIQHVIPYVIMGITAGLIIGYTVSIWPFVSTQNDILLFAKLYYDLFYYSGNLTKIKIFRQIKFYENSI